MGRVRSDLHNGFRRNGDWEAMPRNLTRDRRWYPNHSLYHKEDRVVQLASIRSGKNRDWSINLLALEEHIRAQDDGRVTRAYVTLWDDDAETGEKKMVASDTAKNVWEKVVKNAGEPLKGEFGDYYWVDERFLPIPPPSKRGRNGQGSFDWPV